MAFSTDFHTQTVSFALSKPFLLIVLLSHLVSCASIPLRDSDGIYKGPIPGTNELAEFHCSNERTWVDTRFFDYKDCFNAMMFMQHQENVDMFRPGVPKEFVSQRARPDGNLGQPILTPRKYTIGTFVLPQVYIRVYIRVYP